MKYHHWFIIPKVHGRSLILIIGLCLAPVFSGRPARAQELNLRRDRAQFRALPLGTLAAEKKPTLKLSLGGMLVRESLSTQRPHLIASSPMAPAPDPPSSVTPFQPNITWGGRTVAIDVSPSNTAVAIAASESGGLFLTVDSGATWTHIDTLPPFRMSDVKFAPSNSRIVIASAWADRLVAHVASHDTREERGPVRRRHADATATLGVVTADLPTAKRRMPLPSLARAEPPLETDRLGRSMSAGDY